MCIFAPNYSEMRFKALYIVFIFFLSAPIVADVVPTVHHNLHKQLQAEQHDALLFQMFCDSLSCQEGDEDEPFSLFQDHDLPGMDFYADWDDQHVDPTRGKTNYKIPDSLDISLKGWFPPIIGRVNSPYGWRRRRMHRGVDLKLYVGDTVRSAFDGQVRIKKLEGLRKGYGYYLVLRHPNGFETVYGHLSKFLVDKDQYVKAGEPIALGGNTGRSSGPHLHFEFRVMGIDINPADIINFETFEPKSPIYKFRRKQAQKVSEGLAGTGGTGYHKVKKGDTLGAIASRYHTSVSRLCQLNGIKSTAILRIGQNIRYK